MSDKQLMTMDAIWRALRAEQITEDLAHEIGAIVRKGHVYAARRRLTEARRDQTGSGT